MKPIGKLYSLRDFYTEEGKSLRMSKSHAWSGFISWRDSKVCKTPIYFLISKLYRINRWHKIEVLRMRNKRSYSITDIWNAKHIKHKPRLTP